MFKQNDREGETIKNAKDDGRIEENKREKKGTIFKIGDSPHWNIFTTVMHGPMVKRFSTNDMFRC